MTLWDSVILGVVEGVTEFLPISSTGHLILTSTLLGIPDSAFISSFEIAIQLGAILAVPVLFFKSFLDIEILKRLVVAFIPTAIIGLLAYSFVKTYLLGNELVVVIALAVGGALLIIFELLHKENDSAPDLRTMPYLHAALIGCFQALAIIPGVSRSAATIVGGLLLGVQRVAIVEFSFLLAVPTMLAATGLDLLKTSASFTGNEILMLAIGFVISFIVALASIKWLLAFVRTNTFIPFGIYRLAAALLFFLFVLA